MPHPDLNINLKFCEHCEEPGLAERVSALEAQVMALADDLTALNAEVAEWREDIQAALAALQAQIDALQQAGVDLTAAQAAFDTVKATVDGGVAQVGDADGDGNPAPAPTP